MLITLGGLSLRNGSSPSNPSSLRKPLALLAVVAASGENGVSRERLQALFWPESDSSRARGGLKQVHYLLRGALSVDPFIARGAHVALDRNAVVADCTAFELAVVQGRLTDAVALYSGPFLDGVYLKDLPEFDHWVEDERARLAARFGLSLERLGQAAEEAGDAPSAVEWWRQRTVLDRLDERVAARYVHALVAAGNREGAMRHLRLHAELMRAELDAEPDIAMLALAQELRATPAVAATAHSERFTEDGGTSTAVRDAGSDATASNAAVDMSALSPHPVTPRRWRATQAALFVVACVTLVMVPRSRSDRPTTVNPASTADVNPPMRAEAVPLSSSDRAETTPPGPVIGRVLVVPLANASRDSTQRDFGRLAADVMLSALTQTGLVDVVDAQTTAVLTKSNATLTEGDEPDVRALAARAGANTVVMGRYYSGGDSLFVQVMIEAAGDGRVLRALPVIGVRATDLQAALARLRDRVAGAFATLVDPRISSLVDRSTPAPSLIAYRAYAEGLDCYISQQGGVGQQGGDARRCDAARSFADATRADSTWTLPYIWLMDVQFTAGRTVQVDSLLALLEPRRLQLPELDRFGVEYFRSHRAGDAEGTLRAARHAAALAPRSNWVYKAALAAWQLGRSRESLTLLRQYDPEHGWVKGWAPYVILTLEVEHRLGLYKDELRDAEIAARVDPGNGSYVTFRLRALAGLRDTVSMLRIVDSVVASAPDLRARRSIGLAGLLATAQGEAVAHQNRGLVTHIGARCLEITEPMVLGSPEWRNESLMGAGCLYSLERWSESRRLAENLRDVAPPGSHREQFLAEQLLAHIDAHLGDTTASFSHLLRAVDHSVPANRHVDSLVMMARIASIRGDKAGAVHHLSQLPTLRLGMMNALHTSADFGSLTDYPPYRALLHKLDPSAFFTSRR